MLRKKVFIITLMVITTIIIFNWSFCRAVISVLTSKVIEPDVEYIKSAQWSHDSGFKVGMSDFLEFDENDLTFELKGDTINYKGKPKAIIYRLNKYLNGLEVISIDTKEIGHYTNTKEYTE
jgi:hypothetical protein